MEIASRYVFAFDRKWRLGDNPAAEPLLGTPDMQSLADLNNSMTLVREMRWLPAGRRLLICLSAAVIVPLVPLLFLKYQIKDLLTNLFQSMAGF